jgi:hypothetical protein
MRCAPASRDDRTWIVPQYDLAHIHRETRDVRRHHRCGRSPANRYPHQRIWAAIADTPNIAASTAVGASGLTPAVDVNSSASDQMRNKDDQVAGDLRDFRFSLPALRI